MGELYFGAPLSQKITNIIFDTGSDVLAIMSKGCENCPKPDIVTGDYYDLVSSEASVEGAKDVNQAYGSALIKGTQISDTVCLGQIDLRDEIEAKTDAYYNKNDSWFMSLDANGLADLQERETKDLLEIVETHKNCISQFPFLAVEQE